MFFFPQQIRGKGIFDLHLEKDFTRRRQRLCWQKERHKQKHSMWAVSAPGGRQSWFHGEVGKVERKRLKKALHLETCLRFKSKGCETKIANSGLLKPSGAVSEEKGVETVLKRNRRASIICSTRHHRTAREILTYCPQIVICGSQSTKTYPDMW